MSISGPLQVDVAIFGGGAAGLWLLDDLVHRGYCALLLEAGDLGQGQTIASQGIVHGGLKYTLGGLVTPAARAIREMPEQWRRCLAGERQPNLQRTRLRGEYCHLWRTEGLTSKVSMIGAKMGLRVRPISLDRENRPPALAACPGQVARLDEQVLEPASLLIDLADQHRSQLLKIDTVSGLELQTGGPGAVTLIRLIDPAHGDPLDIAPARVVFAAGAGNEELWSLAGGSGRVMQRRPLHMVLARGSMPHLNGHCVDGAATRVTITSSIDCQNQVVWQIGGQLAETGVDLEGEPLIERARHEIAQVLPAVQLDRSQWSTYRVDRAEGITASGRRPDLPTIRELGNVIAAWPTKMALVPVLASRIVSRLDAPRTDAESFAAQLRDRLGHWPRPTVAVPPWERSRQWVDDFAVGQRA